MRRTPRRRWFFLGLTLIGWGLAVVSAAAPPASKPLTIDDVLQYRPVSRAVLSPDGRAVAFVVARADLKENLFNTDVWIVATSPGASPVQLTNGPKRDENPKWSPDGRRLAFLSNRDGKMQIWLISPTGGEATRLTDSPTDVADFEWSPDGSKIAYTAPDPESEAEKKRKEEEGDYVVVDQEFKLSRLHVIDVATKAARNLTPDAPYHVRSMDWSPDGRFLAFSAQPTPKVPDNFATDIYVVPADGSAPPRKVVDRPGLDTNPRWSPDGRWIAFESGDGKVDWTGNTYICLVSPTGGDIRNVTRSFDEEIQDFLWSPDGRWIYFLAGQRVSNAVFAVEVSGGPVVRLPADEDVYASVSLSRDGRVMAFLKQDPLNPPDVYVAAVTVRGGPSRWSDVRRVTDMNPQLREFAFGAVETVRWKSTDGLEVEGLLVKPVGFEAGQRYPLLVIIHGGPAGVFNRTFSLRRGVYPVQVFAHAGYLVFLPNPRGSGAYGERFRKMNFRDWGGKDYEDILTGVQALVDRGLADPDRMGVMGWSYGGYMTAWVITQTDRFQAASVGAGVTDLFSMFGTTDIPPFMAHHFGKPPWEDKAIYLERSALYHVERVKTPTLIQHGDQDLRVPTLQSWELYTALKMRGVPVQFVLYPRQGHAIEEPRLLRAVMRHNLEWFDRWLKGREARPTGRSADGQVEP